MTNEIRILRMPQLSAKTGKAPSTVYDTLDPESPRHDPTFPKPIPLGKRAVGWIESEVNSWLEIQIQARDQTQEAG